MNYGHIYGAAMKCFVARAGIIVVGLLQPILAFAARQYNMNYGVTPISQDIYDLHMAIFGICVAIGVIVFSVLIYALIKHRKSRGVKPAKFHEHPVVEITWAVIPFLILVVMAIPASKVVLRMEDYSRPDMTIKITGYQWKWRYDYLDEGFGFFSNLKTTPQQINNKAKKGKWYLLNVDKPLVVPIHKKIRFLVTSNDVIHSWWVPALGIKRDAIPGFIHESWARINKPGVYRGQCAELCGRGHAFMPIVVVAKTQKAYQQWLADHKQTEAEKRQKRKQQLAKEWTRKELVKRGKKVYSQNCAVCHQPDGKGQPPAFPALKGSSVTIGSKDKHIDTVLNGVSGTAMQAFGPQLNDVEIAAVVTYERNAWGNDNQDKYGKQAGGVVQPKTVKQMREKAK